MLIPGLTPGYRRLPVSRRKAPLVQFAAVAPATAESVPLVTKLLTLVVYVKISLLYARIVMYVRRGAGAPAVADVRLTDIFYLWSLKNMVSSGTTIAQLF